MITKNIMKSIGVFCAICGMVACADDTTEPVLQLRQAATLNAVSPADIIISKDNSTAKFPEISSLRTTARQSSLRLLGRKPTMAMGQ